MAPMNIKECLSYDPVSGEFRWLKSTGPRAIAGNIAGSLRPDKRGRCYRAICINRTTYLAHRLAWWWMTGEEPLLDIDHKNGNGLDNSWANLRLADKSQNAANAARRGAFKGVSRSRSMWRARIHDKHLGKDIELGRFKIQLEAAAAYDSAAMKIFGEFARTNSASG